MFRYFLFVMPLFAACGDLNDPNTTFEMTGQNSFVFTDIANPAEPLTSERAEARRIAELEQYFRLNGLCPSGYTVSSREPLVIGQFAGGQAYRVTYRG